MSKPTAPRSPTELREWLSRSEPTLDSPPIASALEALLAVAPGFPYRCDFATGLPMVFLGHRLETVLGLRAEEMLGRRQHWEDLIHPEDKAPARSARRSAVEHDEPFHLVYRLRHAAGHWCWCADSGAAATRSGTEPRQLAGVVVDLSEQDHLQQERGRRHRAELFTRMAARTAHDFNNLLQSVAGIASELTASDGQRERSLGADLSTFITQGAMLTRQVLATTRSGPPQAGGTELAARLRQFAPTLERILGDRIALRVETCPGPVVVALDPIRFEQILLNLATNARDAIGDRGHCTIRLRRGAEPDTAVVEFEDDGQGIAPEILHRIFDEHFTTRSQLSGSGLGLAIVMDVLEDCHGTVSVESSPGQGATFRLGFPTLPPPSPQTPAP